ncbi:MAG: toxin-antitoxin system YwqK family antitoxin [Mucilaginibacter sp.]
MKYCSIFIITLFYIANCFAQDTLNKRNWLTNSVIERFKVLKTDDQTKVGPYKAFYKRRTLVADGNYNKGKKTGLWSFYDEDSKLIEKYDYDKSEFTFEAPIDTPTDVEFRFDAQLAATDRLTRPLKPGGIYYGFIPYINTFRTPFDTYGLNMDFFDAVVELLVSPGGRLADYKVHLVSKAYQYNQTVNLDVGLFSEEDKQFTPATLNYQPILSRVFIRCSVNDDGSLDFY